MDRKQRSTNIFFGFFCAVLLVCAGGEREIASFDDSVVTANTKFGFQVFDEIRKTEPDQNIFISPFSLSTALAMTLNGAAGDTEQAITDTLQLQGVDPESINTGYAELRQSLLTSDPKVTLTIANALWTRQSIPFKPDFLQRNAQFFEADIETLDFNDPSTSRIINAWVKTHTHGKIQKIVGDEIDPDTVLLLINAIYFKGTWQRKFDTFRTEAGTFQLATGDEKQVLMMKQSRQHPYYSGKNFQAISLAYGDGQMSLYIFLPVPETDLNTFFQHLNAEAWEQWMSQFRERRVSLTMPKFKLEYERTLNAPLKALDMGVAFNPKLADFSRMAPVETLDENLYIREVLHKTAIEVNEEGTEAAAATRVRGRVMARKPLDFTVDRPFFFAIRDNVTKTVLFMGVVVDP